MHHPETLSDGVVTSNDDDDATRTSYAFTAAAGRASGGVLGVAGALLADALRGRSSGDRALTRGLLQWVALIALLSRIGGKQT